MLSFGLCSLCVAEEPSRLIAYDDGGAQLSTVIGLYAPEQIRYNMAVDFSLMPGEALSSTTVLLHAHVGSKLKALEGQGEPRVGVRVNGGGWHWTPLAPFQNDKEQWIEIGLPAGEWKSGLNRVEVDSNVNNPSNRTPETLDLLAATNRPFSRRSWCTKDSGASYSHISDRNVGIRLRMAEPAGLDGAAGKPQRLAIKALGAKVAVNEPVQFVAEAKDALGRQVSPGPLTWSAEGGSIDPWGLFVAGRCGEVRIRVRAGELKAETSAQAELVIPAGIEPPRSARRLASQVPAGHEPLSGTWEFLPDPQNQGEREAWYAQEPAKHPWGQIEVPGCWQAQGYGLDYHGVGWYRREFTLPEAWAAKNAWIRFGGAATKASVWLNGSLVGTHLGNWAPFELSLAGRVKAQGKNLLVVRVEELPDHFSAGFPREIGRFVGTDSHFGGLWQDVSLFATGDVHLSDLFIKPRLSESRVEMQIELLARPQAKEAEIVCSVLEAEGTTVASSKKTLSLVAPGDGENAWGSAQTTSVTLDMHEVKPWSPESPYLYSSAVEVYLDGKLSERRQERFGMRSVERRGSQVLLNGQPISVRGVLHWAYYPELFSTDPSEEQIRKEFKEIRASGFNLVKVCLFLFPKRFYEIADETGMLLWQEYPTWLYVGFPKEGDTRYDADFAREYPEWFRFDRNHPSVILRDLTCEAPQSANWELLKRTYAAAKQMEGADALICDNSSFLIHAITDWYDCHSYRDLDDYYGFVETLARDMRAKSEVRPYLAGEDFDGDTYRDTQAICEAYKSGGSTPNLWWVQNANFTQQLKFDETLRRTVSPEAPRKLVEASRRHVLALRKAYIEGLCRYPELAGYAMTHVRDVTVTRPGFYDDLYRAKWSPEEWKAFNADRVLVFAPQRRSRCFSAGEGVKGELIVSNYASALTSEPLVWRLVAGEKVLARGEQTLSASRGQVLSAAGLNVALSGEAAATSEPITCRLEAELGGEGKLARNSWPVWIFPEEGHARAGEGLKLYAYSSRGGEAFAAEYPGAGLVAVHPAQGGGGGLWNSLDTTGATVSVSLAEPKDAVLVTDVLDSCVQDALASGTRVVYLARDDDSSTQPFPRQEAPFWRETAIWVPQGDGALGDFPNEGFVDLQFLDLTQRKPFVLGEPQRGGIRPIIWGTSARNPGAAVYDYVFEQKGERGRLIVSCLKLGGKDNVAGRHLLRCLAAYAAK